MRKTIAMIGAAAALLTVAAPISIAQAAPTRYYYTSHHSPHYYYLDRHNRRHYVNRRGDGCAAQRHRSATTGAIIGTVGGALIGNAVSGGNRTPGTLLGAGVGAYAGHQIGKHNAGC